MNENPKANGKTRRFLEEKGFYIILFLCAAAIGIAGYVLFSNPADSEMASDDTEVIEDMPSERADMPSNYKIPVLDDISPDYFEDSEAFVPEDQADLPVSEHSAEDETAEEAESVPNVSSDTEEVTEVSTVTAASEPKAEETIKKKDEKSAEPTFFVKPVSGEVLKNFNITELVYDRTMGDWRTHNGIDISAENGQTVSTIADGSVAGVYTDNYYGTCVRIEHGGGLVSVYYGLAENPPVKIGDKLSAGDTIGSVNSDTLFESLEPVHLHLEVTRDGEFVDPTALLPE